MHRRESCDYGLAVIPEGTPRVPGIMSYSRVFARQCGYRAGVDSSTLIGLVLLAALLIVGWVAWRRVRQEPRRLANAGWIVVTVLLGIQVLAVLGFSAPLVGLGFLVLMSPLMAVGLAGFLILNGVVILCRERFSLAHSLSLLAGVGLVVAMVVCVAVVLTGERRAFPVPAFIMLTTGWVALMFFVSLGIPGFISVLFAEFIRISSWCWVLGFLLGRSPRCWPGVLTGPSGCGGVRSRLDGVPCW